ncbi:Golgi nucleoside diphosphatase [Geosmithia morbida]|uniref:Golgi nucleoside diphosphatase n=1 Tax=Geosmithia morbida TaxID=1094350 RepID=A0A9P4Z0T4_9HYPO|nr:Golgi nucleoside diphosphatase [Geosmithia morbida]KAF4125349.1 Golgi nucleoside diphosphatase [Geosmithia morbida]
MNAAQYGVILDAGSSGTRVYVYKWKNPARAGKDALPDELRSLPKLKLKESKKIHPGISTFADDPKAVGKKHLKQLIKVATNEIPDYKIAETPIFLLATAGVRMLPKFEQTRLLGDICSWLQTETDFDLPDCKQHVQVIPGETEGLYGWIAANYMLGGFDHPQTEGTGAGQSHPHTYGFLDMGGASAQIAFAPNATEAEKHADDLKLVRMRHLDGTSAEYKVFTTTWLGFGANQARERYLEHLLEQYGDEASEIPDPCMPRGLQTTTDGTATDSVKSPEPPLLTGTGQFDECLRLTYPLLKKDAPCEDDPCLINGQHVPAIDFNVNRFVGVSEYWHTTHSVFGDKDQAYDFATYQEKVNEFCSREWVDIASEVTKTKRKTSEEKVENAREACFKASWLINMLYDGIGIPRVGIEAPSSNLTQEEDDVMGPGSHFQPVDKIDGVELSWTLGKMLLYAAGQVPGESMALPVGFGTNVPSGTPDDFETPGSIPLFPVTDDDTANDEDEGYLAYHSSRSSGAIVLVLVILFVAGWFLRRPEYRRRLMSFGRRRKSRSNRKSTGPLAIAASKLFGGGPHNYERVMEEGDAAEFELGAVSDDGPQSDSSESSRKGQSSGLTTPKLNAERFADDLRPPSCLDRNGLAVRTESRERLHGVGHRSRTGSPQRQRVR